MSFSLFLTLDLNNLFYNNAADWSTMKTIVTLGLYLIYVSHLMSFTRISLSSSILWKPTEFDIYIYTHTLSTRRQIPDDMCPALQLVVSPTTGFFPRPEELNHVLIHIFFGTCTKHKINVTIILKI